mgnify:CR=1 FL=1
MSRISTFIPGAGEWEKWRRPANEHGVSLGGGKCSQIWWWSWLHNFAKKKTKNKKPRWLVHFKKINFMVYEYISGIKKKVCATRIHKVIHQTFLWSESGGGLWGDLPLKFKALFCPQRMEWLSAPLAHLEGKFLLLLFSGLSQNLKGAAIFGNHMFIL